MKQFASWFTHGVPGGSGLRKHIFECKNGTAVIDAVEHFFTQQPDLPETGPLLEPDPELDSAPAAWG
jgi:hypothetical protein